ncbi:MAG TPA: pyrroloquinoline quinone biosynthesis peptide chaperone PqqD [Azonexus sp.]|jgi:pyrroloquinoline quinone biosynthesis protein D|nr:pyrroloquinoline quinone biosynthesis peptide chaperone PqqD [Azonexus sp.]
METVTHARPQLSPQFVFRWEASQDAHILLYPEGLIKLNPAAAEILKRCDGARDAEAIIADLSASFPEHADAIAVDTHAFLDAALKKGWLRST